MCYPLPGPRCSGHAQEKLNSAKQNVEKKKASLASAEKKLEKVLSRSLVSDRKKISLGNKHAQARIAYEDAEKEYSHAVKEYLCSPAGIDKLKEEYGEDSPKYRHAVQTRENRKEKLRESNPQEYGPPRGTTRHVVDKYTDEEVKDKALTFDSAGMFFAGEDLQDSARRNFDVVAQMQKGEYYEVEDDTDFQNPYEELYLKKTDNPKKAEYLVVDANDSYVLIKKTSSHYSGASPYIIPRNMAMNRHDHDKDEYMSEKMNLTSKYFPGVMPKNTHLAMSHKYESWDDHSANLKNKIMSLSENIREDHHGGRYDIYSDPSYAENQEKLYSQLINYQQQYDEYAFDKWKKDKAEEQA